MEATCRPGNARGPLASSQYASTIFLQPSFQSFHSPTMSSIPPDHQDTSSTSNPTPNNNTNVREPPLTPPSPSEEQDLGERDTNLNANTRCAPMPPFLPRVQSNTRTSRSGWLGLRAVPLDCHFPSNLVLFFNAISVSCFKWEC